MAVSLDFRVHFRQTLAESAAFRYFLTVGETSQLATMLLGILEMFRSWRLD